MKTLNHCLMIIAAFCFCIPFVLIVPADATSAELSLAQAAKLDCEWECDEKRKQCTCTGKDCPTCTGNTKAAYGGRPIVIGIQTCSTKCNWECTGSIDGQCVEWEKNCITVCRGR